MDNQTFSNQFDIMVNAYARTAGFGNDVSDLDVRVDEYEKSLFLTKAQEETILSLYTGRNSSGNSFEETEELRRYLANLIKDATKNPITNSSGAPIGGNKSFFFTLPSDVWFITYESVTLGEGAPCGKDSQMEVVPVKQDEYNRLKKNPFRGANNRRALRLDLSEGNIEIVSKFDITSYYVRYLKKLEPIILVDLPDGLKIEGISTAKECEVHESLHQRILENAVIMALQSKGININNENK